MANCGLRGHGKYTGSEQQDPYSKLDNGRETGEGRTHRHGVRCWDIVKMSPRTGKRDGADCDQHDATRNPKDLGRAPCWTLDHSRRRWASPAILSFMSSPCVVPKGTDSPRRLFVYGTSAARVTLMSPSRGRGCGRTHPSRSDDFLHFVPCVLQVFSGVLQPGLGLVRLALVLEIAVAGNAARRFLDPAFGVLGSI